MKKQFKYLAAAGLVAALLLAAGCGDDAKDKKPAPEPDKKVENVVVKPQDGKYYRYPDYINDVTKTPKMTPEIVSTLMILLRHLNSIRIPRENSPITP